MKYKTFGMIAAIVAVAAFAAMAIAPVPVAHAQNSNGNVCTDPLGNCNGNANQESFSGNSANSGSFNFGG